MALSPLSRKVGKITAALGALQSLAWLGLTFACIIVYNWDQTIPVAPTSYTEFIKTSIYVKYLYQDGADDTFIIRPRDFTIFMWIYLILSALWLAVSLDQYNAIHYNKNRKAVIMIVWGTLTLVISVVDLIFACLLARDYSSCSYSIEDNESTRITFYCFLSIGIAMTVVARGFGLWLFNVVTSIVILSCGSEALKTSNKPAPELLYGSQSIPRAHVSKHHPYSNRSTMVGEYNASTASTLPAALNNKNQNIYF